MAGYKQITLPSGGKVTIQDDGRPVKVTRTKDGDRLEYGNGGVVNIRKVPKPDGDASPSMEQKGVAGGAPMTCEGTEAPRTVGIPKGLGLSMEQLGIVIVDSLKPIFSKQKELLTKLEERVAKLEAKLR